MSSGLTVVLRLASLDGDMPADLRREAGDAASRLELAELRRMHCVCCGVPWLSEAMLGAVAGWRTLPGIGLCCQPCADDPQVYETYGISRPKEVRHGS